MALILVANQSGSERQRLRQILEIQDHVVVEADTSSDCIEIAECHHPECILLNPIFPNTSVDNIKLVQRLQTLQIPTILMTQSDHHDQYRHEGVTLMLDEVPEAEILYQHLVTILKSESAFMETPAPLTLDADSDATIEPTPSPSMSKPTPSSPSTSPKEEGASLLDIDRLQMLMSLGVQEASETLIEITDCPINFQVPVVETISALKLQTILLTRFGTDPVCSAQLGFTGEMSGEAQLFFPQDSAIALVAALTAEDPTSEDFAELKQEALTEIGNIVLNSIMGAMSNEMTQHLTFSVPTYQEGGIESLTHSLASDTSEQVLLAKAPFMIESMGVAGEILLFFKMRLFFDLIPETVTLS